MKANLIEFLLNRAEKEIEECETTYNRLIKAISLLTENEYYKEADWAREQLAFVGSGLTRRQPDYIPETLSEYREIVNGIRAGLN